MLKMVPVNFSTTVPRLIRRLGRERFIRATPPEVWAFFSTPVNLNELTPPNVGFPILGEPPVRRYAGQLMAYGQK